MKKAVTLAILISSLLTLDSYNQNVGINSDGSSPESNTMLDIKSVGTTTSTFGIKIKNPISDSLFVVRDDGNIGIGLNNPIEKINVLGNIKLSGALTNIKLGNDQGLRDPGNADLVVMSSDAWPNVGQIRFFTDNPSTEKMTIATNGNVGIGTNSPGALLSIANGANDGANYGKGIQITNLSGNSQQIAFIRDGFNVISAGYHGANSTWGFGSGTTTDANFNPDYLAIKLGDGNVGIGDAEVDARLEISGNGGTNDLFMVSSDDNNDGDLMVIKNNGNIGIGTNNPYRDLLVSGSFPVIESHDVGVDDPHFVLSAATNNYHWAMRLRGASNRFEIGDIIQGTRFVIDNSGNVGIGTVNPSAMLEVCGNTRIVGQINANSSNLSAGLTCSSDRRLKKQINSISNPLTTINQIEGRTYFWKSKKFEDRGFSEDMQYGFIAQELEKVLPTLVHTGKDGFKSVNYVQMIPILTEAIKDQQQLIEKLSVENEKLTNSDEELKATLTATRSEIDELKYKLDQLINDKVSDNQ